MCSQECEPVIKAVKSDLWTFSNITWELIGMQIFRPYPFPMESDTPERGPSDVLTSAPSDSEQVDLETHCNRKYVEREAGREQSGHWHLKKDTASGLESAQIFLMNNNKYGKPRQHSVKDSACQCSNCKRCGFNPLVRKIPENRKWQLTPVFLSGESHGQRNLASHNSWGHRVRHN